MSKEPFLLTDLSDLKVFNRVFHKLYSPLCSFAFKYVEDHSLVEDIVQEVFSKVWQQSSEIKIRTNVESYLYGAVRNACLNHIKHAKIVERHLVYESRKTDYTEVDFLEIDELKDRIASVLDALPDRCREIFSMSREEELSYAEIADKLDISVKTVETQISRALKVLRKELRHYIISLIFF